MSLPRIIVNAKVYVQVTGTAAARIADACQTVGEEAGLTIGLAPPHLELAPLARGPPRPHVRWYAQHCDPNPPGSGTGSITVEAVQAAGAQGSILNHAERKVPHDVVARTVRRLQAVGLDTLVCADSPEEIRSLAPLDATFLAVEPPALIGGDVSVTRADPGIVSDAVAAVTDISPVTRTLCGAGIKTGKDVATAVDLGAWGVLLASGVVKADDPVAVLRDLVAGLP